KTVWSGPQRRLSSCTKGDTAAKASSGTEPSTPSAAGLRPVPAPTRVMTGPSAVRVGRRFAATTSRLTARTSVDSPRAGGAAAVVTAAVWPTRSASVRARRTTRRPEPEDEDALEPGAQRGGRALRGRERPRGHRRGRRRPRRDDVRQARLPER